MSCFPEPHNHRKNKMEAKLNLSNYATKSDLKTERVLIHHIFKKTP